MKLVVICVNEQWGIFKTALWLIYVEHKKKKTIQNVNRTVFINSIEDCVL